MNPNRKPSEPKDKFESVHSRFKDWEVPQKIMLWEEQQRKEEERKKESKNYDARNYFKKVRYGDETDADIRK